MTKRLALCEIAALAKKSEVLRHVPEGAILEALQDRETLGSTAFGNGVAIPHCRMRDVKDFVVGLMTIPQGLDFEAEDQKRVKLMVFIIAPRQQSNTHVRLLSVISQALQDTEAVEKMTQAKDEDQLRQLFLEAARQDISEQVLVRRNMVHVFVQDEKVFREILESLSGLENVSLAVVDAKRCRSYLPIYADFVENGDNACKVITVIVERRLNNEVIRRIETITGSLFECIGVMVTVQELNYAAGSLEV